MTGEEKTRTCLKCRQAKPLINFARTPSKFFPGHHSLICTQCLETMVPQDNFGEVDRLCRYLDIPFDLDKWTALYKTHKDRTLSAYLNLILDQHYASLQWADENQRWRLAREEGTIDDEIAALSQAKIRKLKKVWSPLYTNEQLFWLDEYYNQILATQNVSTPILQHYARDLCEIELRIKKSLREGADIKKDMDARDNIIKIAKFQATNAKNAADFQSVGQLMVYFGKKGWHPNWHNQPRDSVDFLMENIQNYLQRLAVNEGNFAQQVETKREQYNLSQRLEEIENQSVDVSQIADVQYEGEEQLMGDLE